MSVAEVIRKKITEDFAPSVLEVENESLSRTPGNC